MTLAIDADGKLFWNDQPITEGDLEPRLAEAVARNPQPELHLHADKNTRYEKLAQVMAAAQHGGITKMDFVTVPLQP